MGAVGLLTRGDIRRRWRSLVALALMVGAVGAIVLAAAAGAWRSDTSLARFNAYSRSSDLEITVGKPTRAQLRAFLRTPEIVGFATIRASFTSVPSHDKLTIGAPVDSNFGNVVDRARVISGRAADPNAADELTIGEKLAAESHLRAGSYLDAVSYTPTQAAHALATGNPGGGPEGPRLRMRIVGIERRPLDLGVRGAAGGVVVATPGFDRKYAKQIGDFGLVLRVRTRDGAADVPAVTAAARRLFGSQPTFDVTGLAIESEGARNAIDVLTAALWIFAAVAALAGGVAIAIVLTREISLAAGEQSTLHALGMTRAQRIEASAASTLLIAAGGAVLAALGAVALSPLFPIGVARRADPDVGLHVDVTVILLGFVVVAAVVLLISVVAAVRTTRDAGFATTPRSRRRPSVVADAAARAGLSPATTSGLRMALEPGTGRSAVPTRSALLGAVLGVLGVSAVFTFAASLDHLVATPRVYGWNWDIRMQTTDGFWSARDVPAAQLDPAFRSISLAGYLDADVDGRPAIVWGFISLRGTIGPEIVSGRAPRANGEIALGAVTMRALHKHIGDRVRITRSKGMQRYRIVGQVVLPNLGDPQPLADGAVLTSADFSRLLGPNMTSRYVLARFAPGADRNAVRHRIVAAARRLLVAANADPSLVNPIGPTRPAEVDRLRQIDWFPATLAALLAILALLAMTHSLVTAVRRRRRELALLKTLGFDRRQIRATVAWHASTLGLIGVALGVPLGVVVGRLVWTQIADGLGVSNAVTIPVLSLALTAVAVLVLVNLVAFFPARVAARTRAAVALRAE